MARLKGTIERITFQSEETGFTVARLRPEEGGAGTDGLVTVVGETMSLAAGESVVLTYTGSIAAGTSPITVRARSCSTRSWSWRRID